MQKKLTLDILSKYLENNGMKCISMLDGNKRIYVDSKEQLIVKIEENIPDDELTSEDIKRIENRLRALGYLD